MDQLESYGGRSDVEVVVHLEGRRPIRGKVNGVASDGVSAVLPKSASLPLGSSQTVSLSIDACERLVTVTAIVRARSDSAGERRYGFTFASPSEIDAQLPHGLRSLFNRRRAERHRLLQPMAVTVSPMPTFAASGSLPPPASAALVLAKLDGASRGGCSLLLTAASEERLATCERLLIRVDLAPAARSEDEADAPDTTRTLCIEATVHHRMLGEDGAVRYGCEFDPLDRESARVVERFVAYLLERERS